MMPIFGSPEIHESYIQDIIDHITSCCRKMKVDFQKCGRMLPNDENKITNALVEEYLRQDRHTYLRYELQSLEGYDADTFEHRGVADIKIFHGNQFRIYNGYYYIVECKRIDGNGMRLNKEYVKNGVHRYFANPPKSMLPPPKYRSPYHENLMLGYVVKELDVDSNTRIIERLQYSYLKQHNVTPSNFELKYGLDAEYFDYSCSYQSEVDENERPDMLRHIFYNLSSIIQ